MKSILIEIKDFLSGMLEVMFKGSRWFYLWMSFLTLIAFIGLAAYIFQMKEGLEITNMREQVSWGFYISNFTFLVGVAAAAVLLIIPAYLYHFKAIKKIVVFGELLAITAVLMAMLFVLVDIGRPGRLWHILPLLGSPNLPKSILAWDFLVLNGYLLLNIFAVVYIGCNRYYGREPDRKIIIPLVMISIPWAVAVHTVTAFVYNGMGARTFWNASILAPRFLASAFSSGPALMLLIFQILRRVMRFEIQDRAIFKIAEIIAYAMGINLFLMFAEIYKEYYTAAQHLTPMKYLYFGLDGHKRLVPWIWTSIVLNSIGFFIFLMPKTRKNFITLNIGCITIFIGVWIEKGMGLILPGFIPDALGEIYEYMPSVYEITISLGILAFGSIFYTLLIRTAIALDTGRLRHKEAPPIEPEKEETPLAVDIMTKGVISVTPDTPVEEIGSILVKYRISGVPVVDENNRVIGVVSESDIIFREVYEEPDLFDRVANIILPEQYRLQKKKGSYAIDIMTSPPITAHKDTPLRELVQTITERRIKRIIIINEKGEPVGVVSRIDLVKAIEKISL